MATEKQVQERRAENDRLRDQIRQLKAKQAQDLAAANHDIAMERADREHTSLEAELASLMGNRVSAEVSSVPAPDTTLVPNSPADSVKAADSAATPKP